MRTWFKSVLRPFTMVPDLWRSAWQRIRRGGAQG